MSFPFIGYFVICNPLPYSRIIAFGAAPLILDTLLRCNSRGAYLGVAAGGICLVLLSRGKARKHAILIVAAGVLAFWLQAQNGRIWERLFSVAVSQEQRDASAESRILSWIAGLEMISDYPYGSGGRAAFVSPRGMRYIQHIRTDEFRSVHNGYLNIAAGWGVQGFTLLMLAFAIAAWELMRAIRRSALQGTDARTFLGAAIVAALVGQAVTTTFGDYLDGEWFIWLSVWALSYARLDEQAESGDAQAEEYEEFYDEEDADPDIEDVPWRTPQFQ
jgi:O-antigen ligase